MISPTVAFSYSYHRNISKMILISCISILLNVALFRCGNWMAPNLYNLYTLRCNIYTIPGLDGAMGQFLMENRLIDHNLKISTHVWLSLWLGPQVKPIFKSLFRISKALKSLLFPFLRENVNLPKKFDKIILKFIFIYLTSKTRIIEWRHPFGSLR